MILLKWPGRCWVKIALPRLSKHTVLLFRLLAIYIFLINSLLTLELLGCIKKLKHKNAVGGRHFIQKMIVMIGRSVVLFSSLVVVETPKIFDSAQLPQVFFLLNCIALLECVI